MLEVMPITRRDLLFSLGAARLPSPRRYHLCLSKDAIEADPSLLDVARDAGVGTIWLAAFLYGYWYASPAEIQKLRERVERAGMASDVVNVPLGHPGDSLGAMHGNVPLTPPKRWKLAVDADGRKSSGCSLHPPATEENCEALRKLQAAGVRQVFLDDDFRFARSPGAIGGCLCEEHLTEFFRRFKTDREHLVAAIRSRENGPLLKAWNSFSCDQLTTAFHRMQAAAPAIRLSVMVMYLGSEKAGIRLDDYRGVPFRVGELMFDDKSFGTVKGKTDELFSALFHRRFVAPELAYSETTAYPADKLSARNMAAKLVVSTIADVRNTMYMSGLTPFPRGHWETLAPAMKRQAEIHRRVAGHQLRGPLSHFWGEASRQVGRDRPYSLFLASGVPFEVTEAARQWSFLSDADAASGVRGISRRTTPETLDAMFALKRSLRGRLRDVPVIEDELPAVCAWYPTAKTALVWNLSEESQTFSLAYRGRRRRVKAGSLELTTADVS